MSSLEALTAEFAQTRAALRDEEKEVPLDRSLAATADEEATMAVRGGLSRSFIGAALARARENTERLAQAFARMIGLESKLEVEREEILEAEEDERDELGPDFRPRLEFADRLVLEG